MVRVTVQEFTITCSVSGDNWKQITLLPRWAVITNTRQAVHTHTQTKCTHISQWLVLGLVTRALVSLIATVRRVTNANVISMYAFLRTNQRGLLLQHSYFRTFYAAQEKDGVVIPKNLYVADQTTMK